MEWTTEEHADAHEKFQNAGDSRVKSGLWVDPRYLEMLDDEAKHINVSRDDMLYLVLTDYFLGRSYERVAEFERIPARAEALRD